MDPTTSAARSARNGLNAFVKPWREQCRRDDDLAGDNEIKQFLEGVLAYRPRQIGNRSGAHHLRAGNWIDAVAEDDDLGGLRLTPDTSDPCQVGLVIL